MRCVIKEILKDEIRAAGNFYRRGPQPKFADIEVLALSLTAESLGIDSANYLFSKLATEYKDAFPNLISRRQYNDRRKLLFIGIAAPGAHGVALVPAFVFQQVFFLF